MFFLVSESYKVVATAENRKEIFGKVNHFCREHMKSNPTFVNDFEDVLNPEGCYVKRRDDVYTIRNYAADHGWLFNGYKVEEVTLHVTSYSDIKGSALKPSYLDAVRNRLKSPLVIDVSERELKPLKLERV